MNTQETTERPIHPAYDKVDDIIKAMTHAELAVFVQSFSNILVDIWGDFEYVPSVTLGRHPGSKFLEAFTSYRNLLKTSTCQLEIV